MRRVWQCVVVAGLIGTGSFAVWGAAAEIHKYRRSDWKHWHAVPVCGTVRDVVLQRDAILAEGDCAVTSGAWRDPYDGTVVAGAASLVDIDHLVPLRWAHDHGGAAWPPERKAAYANDLGYRRHLMPTARSTNRAKGAKGPDEWIPPDPAAHCQYAESWATILVIYDLTPPPAVRDAIRRLAATCGAFGRDR